MRNLPISPPGIVRVFAACLLPAVMYGCGAGKPETESSRNIPTNYVQGSFVISANSTAKDEDLNKLTAQVGQELGCKVNPPGRIDWGQKDGSGLLSEELYNTFHVSFEACDFSQEGTSKILSKLGASESVAAVSPEAIATASPIEENDPMKDRQDHLAFIKRDQACAEAERTGEPIIVAIVDSGIDLEHPDLKSMLLRDERGEIVGANFVGAGRSMPPDRNFDDVDGHGTHVAGLVGAAANNGEGVVGVAACANVKLMPVRVLNDEGSGSSVEIDRGVRWAAEHGAQIINMSLGYNTTTTSRTGRAFYSPLFAEMAAKNVVVLAAAGNDGYTNGSEKSPGQYRYHFPSSYDNVIGVAATNSYGTLTTFSVRGDRVDIAAPGSAVLATKNGGGYIRMSGTSMATPVAAGSYALALATARGGLDRQVDRVDLSEAEEVLKASTLSSVSLDSDNVASGGVIDVQKLVEAMKSRHPHRTTQPTQPTEPTQPTQPTEPDQPDSPTAPTEPTTPIVSPTPITSPTPADPSQDDPAVQPIVAPFEFAGMTNGQRAGFPQELKLSGLPKGTRKVYFYWSSSWFSFSKVSVDEGATEAKDSSRWYLYGNRTLKAVAYDANGNRLGQATVQLRGW